MTIGANIVSDYFYDQCVLLRSWTSTIYLYFIRHLIVEGVRAKVYFKAIPELDEESGLTFLTVDKVKMDFSVKDIQMGVDNVANGNTIIRKKDV